MKDVTNLKNVVSVLPVPVKRSINMLPDEIKEEIREILLRTGKPVMLVGKNLYYLRNYGRTGLIDSPDALVMSGDMMQRTFMNMCDDSVYTYMDNINSGFLTLSGGSRVGVCGRFVHSINGQCCVRNVSSLSIRISSQHIGISDSLMQIYLKSGLGTTLVAGPPCSGKTTLLRDICRNLSGGTLEKQYKITLIDERCELSGVNKNDVPLNVGVNTDIYLNYDKSKAIEMSVRTMSPDMIIFDEIGDMKEIESVCKGMNSGVYFAFSMHANSFDELQRKEQYKLLCNSTNIKYIVLLSRESPGKIKEVLISDENGSFVSNNNNFNNSRSSWKKYGTQKSEGIRGYKAVIA